MKLTKLQRHSAYIIMLAEAETDFDEWSQGSGLCHLILQFREILLNNTVELPKAAYVL